MKGLSPIPPIIAILTLAGCALPSLAERPTAPSAATSSPATLASTATPTVLPEAITSTAEPTAPALMPTRLSQSAELLDAAPDVTLDVELFYLEHWMKVRQTVALDNHSPDAWSEIVFNVPINATPTAFYLDQLHVILPDTTQDGTPSFITPETILRVPMPRPVMPGEAVLIAMEYRVLIPPVAATDWPPVGTTGWRFELIQAGEWYPALVPYIDDEGWHTWDYRRVGDPTVYPLVDTRLNVKVEPGITVVSGGALGQDAEGIWRFEAPAGRGVAFLASDRFTVLEGEANGIPVYSYYLAEHGAAGEAALEIAEQSVVLFEELYGPYPYTSLTVAENGFFGGMEYSALITITDYAYANYHGQSPSLLHALISHETAHQWWYGAVGNDQANEPWLDESLAFYSELLYFERYNPDVAPWWWERRVNIYNPHGPVDATIYTYDQSASFITSMYGQAARFLHELRETMGDEAFFAFLRDYYTAYAGQLVTGQDFKAMAREHSSSDLTPLFEAYFANPEP